MPESVMPESLWPSVCLNNELRVMPLNALGHPFFSIQAT